MQLIHSFENSNSGYPIAVRVLVAIMMLVLVRNYNVPVMNGCRVATTSSPLIRASIPSVSELIRSALSFLVPLVSGTALGT